MTELNEKSPGVLSDQGLFIYATFYLKIVRLMSL